jgi:hypothetical protein
MVNMPRWILWSILALLVLPVAGFALWAWVTLNFAYSSGERVGFVQKISHKGWICKTWEGELSMVTVPGTPAQNFPFSVRDEGVAQRLMKASGQRVRLKYEQHRGVPSDCFGETEYYVTGIEVLPNP